MFRLNDREWKPFKLEEIFTVDKGTYVSKKDFIEGDNLYITARAKNNGVSDFIENKKLFSKGCITIEKVNFSAFYQPYDFYCSHDVCVLISNKINKYSGLFICTMLKKQGEKYSYGRQAQLNVVKRESIFLPVDENGEPDYDFMESYIKQKEDSLKEEYKLFIQNEIEKLNLFSYDIKKLESKEWKEFYLTELFTDIRRGKRITKSQQSRGKTPYVSSTSLNNGVDNFISESERMRKYSNCLTIANSGSVGSSFYQPFEFIASDHITHLKDASMNKYIYLFIATITKRLSEKYNFNREISDKRISREKIILPVNKHGEPDYEYMEQYIKNIMKNKYDEYINYLEKLNKKH